MGKRKGKKQYYAGAKRGKYQNNRILSDGMAGFLITCNNREREAVQEAYNLLNEYADNLYGPEAKKPKDQPEVANGQTEGNGDATNGKAVSVDTDTLKNDNDNKNVDDGADSDEDCNFDDIDAALEKEKKKILEIKQIDMQNLINQSVRDFNAKATIELKTPQVCLYVEIIRNIFCLGVAREFFKHRKYNLQEMVKSEEEIAADIAAAAAREAKKNEEKEKKSDDASENKSTKNEEVEKSLNIENEQTELTNNVKEDSTEKTVETNQEDTKDSEELKDL